MKWSSALKAGVTGLVLGGALLLGPSAAADEVGSSPDATSQASTVSEAGSNSTLSCAITAMTPYASGNLVWTGAGWSGCTGSVRVSLKWDRVGPDGTIGTKNVASNGYAYGWGCNWGNPQNRILYGGAEDSVGVGDESSHVTFTSATTSCVF